MNIIPPPKLPPQPDLRAFIIYTALPKGCIAFEVPDNTSSPYLCAGEFVVIDPEDRDPAEGELFVITWKSDVRQKWQIVRMDLRWGRYGNGSDASTYEERFMWFIGGVAPDRMMNSVGHPVGCPIRRADGPYNADYCREISHGKIVGILESDFRRLVGRM
ncbi:hypothetical protein [Sphingomonas sp. PR090111-T3T-6A]|uniref:hypothetical protein n=1 Tax=Sphingomonas sp. PR090111-T3T-6A TaxID=685778 RepID=UPI0003658AD7|nr:hypothetical protein [Sphingomonas sp. PR090111-T3T-6A]